MSKPRVALFDVDGVLILPPKLFSDVYCEKYGVDLEGLLPFYGSKEFKDSSVGKLDLKEAIKIHNDKWHWRGDPADLINEWLQVENYPNLELLKIVDDLRKSGIKTYVVTQQEKYRAAFLKDVVFKDRFDGFFMSCEMGLHKDSEEFWQKVLKTLEGEVKDLELSDVIYFDDKQKFVDLAASKGVRSCLYTKLDDVTQQLG